MFTPKQYLQQYLQTFTTTFYKTFCTFTWNYIHIDLKIVFIFVLRSFELKSVLLGMCVIRTGRVNRIMTADFLDVGTIERLKDEDNFQIWKF